MAPACAYGVSTWQCAHLRNEINRNQTRSVNAGWRKRAKTYKHVRYQSVVAAAAAIINGGRKRQRGRIRRSSK